MAAGSPDGTFVEYLEGTWAAPLSPMFGGWIVFPAGGSEESETPAPPVRVEGSLDVLAAGPASDLCGGAWGGAPGGSVTCAGLYTFGLGIGAIEGDIGSLVVMSGTNAVAGPNVLGGSNTLK